jgi:hypothetical protein
MDTPNPIRLLLVANLPYLQADDQNLITGCQGSDLVVSLGGVDLEILSQALPPGKPALAVIGPKDPLIPDSIQNIKGLHASGFNFRNWLIAGISGGPRLSSAKGFYLPENEAESLLKNLPACNIFFSHAFPQGLRESQTVPEHSMEALDRYLIEKPPIYYFYANPKQTVVEEYGDVLAIGVNGIFETPALEFV